MGVKRELANIIKYSWWVSVVLNKEVIYMLALLITILAAVITLTIFILAQYKDEIWENIKFKDD